MELDLHEPGARKNVDLGGESRAYVLLECARLRCESLLAGFGPRDQLLRIHREVGLAGFVTCEPFGEEHRRGCLTLAASRLAEDSPAPGTPLTTEPPRIGRTLARMFSETIAASDALASQLATGELDDEDRDRLHLAHAHVMSACELLDERLTVLELQDAGLDAAI